MNTGQIDIVILSLNRAQMTLDAVTSVLQQQGVEPLIWLLDQGSEPATTSRLRDALAPVPQVRFIRGQRNLGVAEGRNRGIACGSAPIIVCLDNDAAFRDHGALAHVLERFDRDGRLGILGFSIIDSTTGDVDRRSWVYPRAQLQHWRSGFVTTRFCGAGHAVRREAFARAGGYDPSLFFYWEEVDLSNRVIELGYEIHYDPEVVILHKRAPEGRYHWSDNRFYYLVRNALYLEWRFYRSPVRLALMGAGYMLKGAYNGLLVQAVRGIWDAAPMLRKLPPRTLPMGPLARKYIQLHETRYRGNIWTRLRHEVLEKLPR